MSEGEFHHLETDAPLTPSVARRLIVSVLELTGRPMKRDELAQSVVERHLSQGGTPGQQPPQMIVKRARLPSGGREGRESGRFRSVEASA